MGKFSIVGIALVVIVLAAAGCTSTSKPCCSKEIALDADNPQCVAHDGTQLSNMQYGNAKTPQLKSELVGCTAPAEDGSEEGYCEVKYFKCNTPVAVEGSCDGGEEEVMPNGQPVPEDGTQEFESIPICIDDKPNPCVNEQCKVQLCGSGAQRVLPLMSAQDAQDATSEDGRTVDASKVDFATGASSQVIGLYKATCTVMDMSKKTLNLVKKAKGDLWANTFRFGLGGSFADYEESKNFFPLTDRFCGPQNEEATKDRYTNYVLPAGVSEPCTRVDAGYFYSCPGDAGRYSKLDVCSVNCGGECSYSGPQGTKYVCSRTSIAYNDAASCRLNCHVPVDPQVLSCPATRDGNVYPYTNPFLNAQGNYALDGNREIDRAYYKEYYETTQYFRNQNATGYEELVNGHIVHRGGMEMECITSSQCMSGYCNQNEHERRVCINVTSGEGINCGCDVDPQNYPANGVVCPAVDQRQNPPTPLQNTAYDVKLRCSFQRGQAQHDDYCTVNIFYEHIPGYGGWSLRAQITKIGFDRLSGECGNTYPCPLQDARDGMPGSLFNGITVGIAYDNNNNPRIYGLNSYEEATLGTMLVGGLTVTVRRVHVNAATGDAGAFVPVSDIVGRDGRRYAGYQTNANYGNALAIKFIEKCLSGNRMAEDVQSGTVATGSYSYTGGYRDDDSRAWGDLHATNVINVLAKNNDGKLAIGDCEYMGGVGMQIGAYGWCEPCTYSTVARQRVTATLDNNYNITGQDFSPTASYLTERLDEYLKASVMPILDVRDNYNAQRVSTPQTNFAGSLVYEAETDSYRIYSQVFETRPELNGKYRVPIAELVGDRGVVTLVIANVEDFTDEPSGFWAADGTVCEDEENCAPIGDRVNIAKSVSDMMNYWRGNGWRYYNIEKDKIDVLGGREITKREYYLLKANAAKQLCPTCLIAVAARNRDYYEDLLEADSALRWNEENPYGKLFQITRTQLNEQWNVDAQADVVDLIVDDWNIDALEAKDPGTEVDLQVNYSGSLIKRYHKPIFNWGLEIITAYVAADGSRDSNQTDYINVVNEIFGNQRDLTSAGTMGVAYPMWRGGWAALAKQDNVEGKRGDGSWQLLDGGGHYYAGDFCAVYSGSKKILGLKETTLYQKIYASETCECVLCSDDEIYDGMCGNLGLGVASSDGVEMECRMPDGEDPAQYKAPLSCITNSCMKCSASAGTASCSRISEGQAQKMGNVDISELGDIDKDIISALAPERKCCINDSEGNYTYLKYTGEIQKNEQVLYHRSGSIAFDCGKTPDLDPSVCGISINTEPSQVVCTYLE